MKNIILLFFISISLSSFSTHNRAGEILYKRIAPFTSYTYSFTIIRYTDNGPSIADRCEDTLYFGDGQKAALPRINGSTGCGCGVGFCGEIIVNELNYKVKRNVYSGTHTYAAAGNYTAYSMDPNRNNGVINVPNSINLPLYIESLIVANASFTNNSSPVLANPPIERGATSSCFYHNSCSYDEDGDSLSYELTNCKNGPGQIAPGYTYPAIGAGGTFSMNPTNGLLTWCTPQQIGEYNVAFLVKEWRKLPCTGAYYLMGYVERDMQILIQSLNSNSLTTSIFRDTCVVAGTTLMYDINVNAVSANALSIIGSSNNNLTNPNASMNNNFGVGTFSTTYSWATNCTQVSNNYQINLIFTPTSVNMKNREYRNFRLKVVPPAPNVYNVQVLQNQVNLFWTKPVCTTNLLGYQIYRKTGINNWTPGPCETGVPAYSGFNYLGFNVSNDTDYVDTDFWEIPPGTLAHYIVVSVLKDCSNSFASVNSLTLDVGINENENLDKYIFISPNPFQNSINLKIGKQLEEINCQIFSLDGKMLMNQSYSQKNHFSINTELLAKGLYILKVITDRGTILKKVVRE